MSVKNLEDLLGEGVQGRYVLVRSDLNVPLEGDRITDDGRVRAALPTIEKLAGAGAKVVVTAHLGRPKGEPDPKYTLAPVAKRLTELLGADVALAGDLVGDSAKALTAGLAEGGVVLLENVRFDARETSKDAVDRSELAAELAALVPGGAFVSDGFGVVHRKQASVYEIASVLPAYAGGLVLAELDVLKKLTDDVKRPYVVILGGAKVSDKIKVIDRLLDKADTLLIGGAMACTFMLAHGQKTGKSLVEPERKQTALDAEAKARKLNVHFLLPTDAVIATPVDAGKHDSKGRPRFDYVNPRTTSGDISDGSQILDIGPATAKRFAEAIQGGKTILWNGPMGMFEDKRFADGTDDVARAVAGATQAGATSIIGGGDSVKALKQAGLGGKVTFMSTGGGASLEFLEGKELPGVAALDDK